MKIRDRITGLERIPVDQLIPNERNFRKHPEGQSSALSAVLERVCRLAPGEDMTLDFRPNQARTPKV